MTDRRLRARTRPERRRSVRVSHDLEIRTLSEDGELALACAADISEDGIFVEFVLPYPEGTQLRVEFVLPGVGAFSARARVASAQRWLDPQEGLVPGNGLEFVDVAPEAQERLERWLRDRIS